MPKDIMVLQGEFAVVNGRDQMIMTSKPFLCHLLVIQERQSQLLGLFHIDCFTSGEKITQQLFETFEKRLKELSTPLPYDFNIHFGQGLPYVYESTDTDGEDLIQDCQQILEILQITKNYATRTNILRLPRLPESRTPYMVSLKAGEIQLVSVSKGSLAYKIQTLQGMEYGDFNRFLDRCFGDINQQHIPNFEGKEATRTVEELLNKLPNIPNIAEHTVEKFLDPLVTFERTVCVKPEQLKALQDEADVMVNSLLDESSKRVRQAIAERKFNFLLRLLATDDKCLPLLLFLTRHASDFGIDTQSRGKTAGTAEDVARKHQNHKGLEVLSLFRAQLEKDARARENESPLTRLSTLGTSRK